MNIPDDNPTWDTARHEFAFNGAWLDIYVRDVDVETWTMVLAWLATTAELHGDLVAAYPSDVSSRTYCLRARRGGVEFKTHFFADDEVEFDFDPRQITGQVEYEVLCAFLKELAEVVGTHAVLTPENSPELSILRAMPGATHLEYFPVVPQPR